MKYIFPLIIALGFSVSGFAQPPAGDANVGDAYGAKIKAKGAKPIADVVS
jgi:hypothetical protein